MPAVVDVALILALLAAFASVAFVRRPRAGDAPNERAARRCSPIVAVAAGAFFFLAGTVGLLRFPDALTRLHALTKADNLGLGLIVLGLLPQADGAAGRAQADLRLGAGAARRRDGGAADRARRAARRAGAS